MKLTQLALTAGTALALLTLNVDAQPANAPASTAVTAPASPATSPASDKAAKKAERKANHMLEKAVRKALAKDNSIDVTRINVRARSGAVTLLGFVPEQSQGDTATQVAQGVSGVTSVKNALTVKAVGQ